MFESNKFATQGGPVKGTKQVVAKPSWHPAFCHTRPNPHHARQAKLPPVSSTAGCFSKQSFTGFPAPSTVGSQSQGTSSSASARTSSATCRAVPGAEWVRLAGARSMPTSGRFMPVDPAWRDSACLLATSKLWKSFLKRTVQSSSVARPVTDIPTAKM